MAIQINVKSLKIPATCAWSGIRIRSHRNKFWRGWFSILFFFNPFWQKLRTMRSGRNEYFDLYTSVCAAGLAPTAATNNKSLYTLPCMLFSGFFDSDALCSLWFNPIIIKMKMFHWKLICLIFLNLTWFSHTQVARLKFLQLYFYSSTVCHNGCSKLKSN